VALNAIDLSKVRLTTGIAGRDIYELATNGAGSLIVYNHLLEPEERERLLDHVPGLRMRLEELRAALAPKSK
jgi:hypothetical protein